MNLKALKSQVKPLSSLPNKQGFEFTGIKRDGSTIPCRVIQSVEDGYIIISLINAGRVFQELTGWIK
jgi:hypothetical protein